MFHGFFDIWADSRIFFFSREQCFQNICKSLLTCLGGVFWMLHGISSIVRHLSWEPDFEPRTVFYKFRKMTQNMFNNQHAINFGALFIDKLVMNPKLSYVRITTSYIKYRAENYMTPTHHVTHSKCRRPPGQWWLATTLRWAMSFYFKFR